MNRERRDARLNDLGVRGAVRFFVSIGTLVVAVAAAGCATADVPPPLSNPTTIKSLAAFPPERVRIREFSDLLQFYHRYVPTTLALGPDGAIWVSDDIDQDYGESAIVRINPAGRRTTAFYYQNNASPAFWDMVTGPDGNLWITDRGDAQIVRLTTKGTFTTYPLANSGEPAGITVGPDGALWFTISEGSGGAIGRITIDGAISTYTKGISNGASLQDITAGSDNALWFTDEANDKIGRITTTGSVTEFSKDISSGAEPYSIALGVDGALWFTELAGRIGRITTTGSVVEYSNGITPGERPIDLVPGPGNAMWFTEYEEQSSGSETNAKVGRISLGGIVTEYSVPTSRSGPTTIIEGLDDKLWFVETATNRLGRISF